MEFEIHGKSEEELRAIMQYCGRNRIRIKDVYEPHNKVLVDGCKYQFNELRDQGYSMSTKAHKLLR